MAERSSPFAHRGGSRGCQRRRIFDVPDSVLSPLGPVIGRRDWMVALTIGRSSAYVDDVTSYLGPMREPTYFILAALQDQPLHGYAIVKRAGELSDGRVRLTTGTLYAALDRLAGEEMVRVAAETVVNGRARRTYELTDQGLSALQAEAERMVAAARVVRNRRDRSKAATVRVAPA